MADHNLDKIRDPRFSSTYESQEEFLKRLNSVPNTVYAPEWAKSYCTDENEFLNFLSKNAQEAEPVSAAKLFEDCAKAQKPAYASTNDVERLAGIEEISYEEAFAKLSQNHNIVPTTTERAQKDMYCNTSLAQFAQMRIEEIFGRNIDGNGKDVYSIWQGKNYSQSQREQYLQADKNISVNLNQKLRAYEQNKALGLHGINEELTTILDRVYDRLSFKKYKEDPTLVQSLPVSEQKEILRALSDYIVENASYHPSTMMVSQGQDYLDGSSDVLSAWLVYGHNRGICQDYANAFVIASSELGFDSSVLVQVGDAEYDHAAVLVKINGEPYVVDPTIRISEKMRLEEQGKHHVKLKPSEIYSPKEYADLIRDRTISGVVTKDNFWLDNDQIKKELDYENFKIGAEQELKKIQEQAAAGEIEEFEVPKSVAQLGYRFLMNGALGRILTPGGSGEKMNNFRRELSKEFKEPTKDDSKSCSNYLKMVATKAGIFNADGNINTENPYYEMYTNGGGRYKDFEYARAKQERAERVRKFLK